MHGGIGLGGLDERANRCGRGVEDGAFVALDHLPETACVRECGHAFKNDLRGASGQRAIGHIGVAGDPADVGGAPEHVVGADVKAPLHGGLGPHQVTGGAVLHALGFAGGAGGVQDEQRVFGVHRHRRAFGALAFHGLGEGLVAPFHHVAGSRCALIHQHRVHCLAAAQVQSIVDDALEGQFAATAHLVVGSDHGHGAHVHDAVLHRLGAEAAKHHAVRGANAGAGLHGHHALDGHGHVDQDAVTLLDALGLEGIGKLADAGQQLLVGDARHGAVVGLEDDDGLVLGRGADVAVQAVGRSVEFTVGKPAVKRRIALVQCLGERLVPLQLLAPQTRPVPLKIALGFCAQRLVGRHAGHTGSLHGLGRRRKNPVFYQGGLNGGRWCTHGLVS